MPRRAAVKNPACMLAVPQVYCGWGNSDCVLRAGQKVFLPPEAVQAPGSHGIQ